MSFDSSRSFPLRASLRAACAATLLLASSAWAGDLIIKVKGAEAPYGKIGCWLYSSGSTGFPMDPKGTKAIVWVPAAAGEVTCRFPDVAPGRYAASIMHDVNNNQMMDVSPVGQPTEQWAISTNVRPPMRVPTFEDGAFTMPATDLTLDVDLDM
ncbi:DUF2141 domain-containing protein [Bradyrhizobium elkanii]|uniref:DUF2141 domain-containing protein n=1 Tax=Bradyrhizobium elkanii TaxID=29448 RepID=UPI00209CBF5A|nr:DUF2141 domain-containing protein [Bradyrhizobium elkanii]MCP1968475.1 uncharacterized protein (DUF2141 family) [Bradyrhizobium elkanii]MCS4110025.1 uncharacterized protein (DUF2141 family) [Bradyrhizobium elkanii]